MRKLLLLSYILSFTHLSSQSVSAEKFDSRIPQQWFNLELYLIKNGTGFSPPVASRALAYTGIALYHAVYKGIPGYQSIEVALPGSPVFTNSAPGLTYDWRIVANNAMADIIDSLYGNAIPTQKDSIHAVKNSLNSELQLLVASEVYTDSKTLGERIAAEVYYYSKSDGGHKSYLSNIDPNYIAPTGPEKWEPTFPAFLPALQCHWGQVRTIVAADSSIVPAGPPSFSSDTNSTFYAYAYQVYVTKNNLTPDMKNIANFWADGQGTVTPPGHSISILTQLLKKEKNNLAFATLAYAKLGISQMDAFIACWKTKYTYNLMRPITYIRKYIDPSWTSFLGTPNFPEYTSGHSTQSGAMTAVMNELYGSTYSFVDSTNGSSYGGPRSFTGFDQAAYEAATSRLYAGIHYEFSDVVAISLGKQIGNNVLGMMNGLYKSSAGIAKLDEKTDISVYPNPTTDYVMLSYQNHPIDHIEIFDLTGRLVKTSYNPYTVNLFDLTTGVYTMKIYDKNEGIIAEKKIVKNPN